MERDRESRTGELVELGTVSDDTHGAGHMMPEATGLWNREGISED